MGKSTGKYTNLAANTLIFAIGSFSSKLLMYFMMPLLTYVLPPDQMSGVRNAIITCNLILPVMYLCVSEAVIRFGLDPAYHKKDVFSTGILTVLGGYLVFLCLSPFIFKLTFAHGYENLIRIFVLTSAARTVTTHYVRSSGLVRIFALDGIFTSVSTVALTYIFLFKLKLGAPGYMLATICADGLSALTMLLGLKLYRFFKIRRIDLFTAWDMLRYSIPLVPTAVSWWIISGSSLFFITKMVSPEANGIYSVSSTIPNIITMVSAIFIQAWQISAFTEYKSSEGQRFYSNVFRCYYSFIFLAASGIILLIRPVTGFMVDEAYYEAWRFTPFLVLGISFSCFVTFLGTIYNTVKKNTMITVTTVIGAVLNLILNLLLIPKYGPIGAAAATFISYLTVFVIRAIDTRKYIKIDMQPGRILLSLCLLLTQIWVCLSQPKFGVLWQILIFAALALCNLGYILFIAQKILAMAKARLGLNRRRG